jgi:hypothetical protein
VPYSLPQPERGDTAGIEHIDALRSYAMVLILNPSEAENLVQETIRSLHQGDG